MILPIRYEDRAVATILREPAALVGSYERPWLDDPGRFPISLKMPLGDAAFGAETLLVWLMNLLPEGEPLRAMSRALGASADDVIGLILETGGDLAGALAIGEPAASGPPDYVPIGGEDALERIIEELPARPFLVGEEGVTMSLAGAQDKLPVALFDGELFIPVNGAPSTHILKPDNPRLIGSVQNEALCMTLARRTGLDAAPVTTGVAGKRSYLLVERYDRLREGSQVRRLHQEDFCQALGVPPNAKYEFNGTGRRGPSVADMFGLARDQLTALDTNRLLEAIIFNIALGNVDSHAKNLSILLQPGLRLAPLYDLMTGLAWDGITPNHAQAIGGQRRGTYIYGRHWMRMAKESGLAAPPTVRRVDAVCSRLLDALEGAEAEVAAMPAGKGPFLDLFVAAIGRRAKEVRDHAKVQGDAAPDAPAEPSEIAGQASAYPHQ